MSTVIVISENKKVFDLIRSSLQSDYPVEKAPNIESASEMIGKTRPNIIFVDIELLKEPEAGGKAKWALHRIWNLSPSSNVIVMSSQEKIRDTVNAVRSGASEYLTYPIAQEEVRYVVESIHEQVTIQAELDYLRDQFWAPDSAEIIQTNHHEMRKVLDRVRLVAPTKTTVLLTGETGTGKGVLARLIHSHSTRKDKQLVDVHCGAIPDTLIESELFGHEKGAFTGAVQRKLGKFEIANGGTIFLDEVGTLTPSAQIKLLKVLQDGVFQRVGGEKTIEVDVRVLSATNLDLQKACEKGQFRMDLYYRLNVFSIKVPALRERIDDIPYFVDLFLKKLEKREKKGIHGVHPEVMEAFRKYPWPGNIRELENVMEEAFILGHSPVLTEENFPQEIVDSELGQSSHLLESPSLSLAEVRRRAVDSAESFYIRNLLAKFKGKIQESATAAGITTRQFNKLMAKYNIDKKEFKSR